MPVARMHVSVRVCMRWAYVQRRVGGVAVEGVEEAGWVWKRTTVSADVDKQKGNEKKMNPS
jgi:hypothetical protein